MIKNLKMDNSILSQLGCEFENGKDDYKAPFVLVFINYKRQLIAKIRVYTKVDKENYTINFGVEGKKSIYLSCLFVKDKYRRQGLARRLIQAVKKKFKNKVIFLHVRRDNKSFNLFSSEGFTIIDKFDHCGEWDLMRLIN